jgi:hypothetical protein
MEERGEGLMIIVLTLWIIIEIYCDDQELIDIYDGQTTIESNTKDH